MAGNKIRTICLNVDLVNLALTSVIINEYFEIYETAIILTQILKKEFFDMKTEAFIEREIECQIPIGITFSGSEISLKFEELVPVSQQCPLS